MWLNPLKGDHLTLRQLDKTLPVNIDDASSAKIERGIFVYISTNKQTVATGFNEPRFALYTSEVAAKPNAVPYIALQSLHDTQANMAGNTVQAPSVSGNLVDDYGVKVGSKPEGVCPNRSGDNERLFLNPMSSIENAQYIRGPRITAVSILSPAEWQTNAYDKTQDSQYYIGCPLSVNDDGRLCMWTQGHNIVGYVTQIPTMRYVNDLGASENGARISGGNVKCIAFSTAWIPVAVSQPGVAPTPSVMSADKPKAAPTPAGVSADEHKPSADAHTNAAQGAHGTEAGDDE